MLTTELLPECETGCGVDGLADMVDFVRQWAQVCALTYPSSHTQYPSRWAQVCLFGKNLRTKFGSDILTLLHPHAHPGSPIHGLLLYPAV